MVKRRRRKVVSLESEIRAKAKQIMDDQMAEAMKAAALMIVGRKLDEIRGLLQGAGFVSGQPFGVGLAPQSLSRSGDAGLRPQPQPVENPCFQCGRPGVRKSPRTKWGPGQWACAAHVLLLAITVDEDKVDATFALNTEPGPKPPPGPVQIVHTPPKEEAPGSDSPEAALAALGVQNAESV